MRKTKKEVRINCFCLLFLRVVCLFAANSPFFSIRVKHTESKSNRIAKLVIEQVLPVFALAVPEERCVERCVSARLLSKSSSDDR